MDENELYYGTWLNYNCPQENNWIVWGNIKTIMNHEDREIIGIDPVEIDGAEVLHVYFTYMTSDILVTLLRLRLRMLDSRFVMKYVLVKNEMIIEDVTLETVCPEMKTVKSRIVYFDNIQDMWKHVTVKDMKKYGIDKSWRSNGSTGSKGLDIDILKLVENKTTLNKIVKKNEIPILFEDMTKNILNLSFSCLIDETALMKIDPSVINKIVLRYNLKYGTCGGDFSWLKNFPKLEWIELNGLPWISLDHMSSLIKYGQNVKIVNIHGTSMYDIKIVHSLLQMNSLEKLLINDEDLVCQKSDYELCVYAEEWESIKNRTLKSLVINSKLMRLEVLNMIINTCPNLELLIVDESILNEIVKKVKSGYGTGKIRIGSWQKPERQLELTKPIKFVGLVEMRGNYTLPESLIKKINKGGGASP